MYVAIVMMTMVWHFSFSIWANKNGLTMLELTKQGVMEHS